MKADGKIIRDLRDQLKVMEHGVSQLETLDGARNPAASERAATEARRAMYDFKDSLNKLTSRFQGRMQFADARKPSPERNTEVGA